MRTRASRRARCARLGLTRRRLVRPRSRWAPDHAVPEDRRMLGGEPAESASVESLTRPPAGFVAVTSGPPDGWPGRRRSSRAAAPAGAEAARQALTASSRPIVSAAASAARAARAVGGTGGRRGRRGSGSRRPSAPARAAAWARWASRTGSSVGASAGTAVIAALYRSPSATVAARKPSSAWARSAGLPATSSHPVRSQRTGRPPRPRRPRPAGRAGSYACCSRPIDDLDRLGWCRAGARGHPARSARRHRKPQRFRVPGVAPDTARVGSRSRRQPDGYRALRFAVSRDRRAADARRPVVFGYQDPATLTGR